MQLPYDHDILLLVIFKDWHVSWNFVTCSSITILKYYTELRMVREDNDIWLPLISLSNYGSKQTNKPKQDSQHFLGMDEGDEQDSY